jgi:hypothetical protein
MKGEFLFVRTKDDEMRETCGMYLGGGGGDEKYIEYVQVLVGKSEGKRALGISKRR